MKKKLKLFCSDTHAHALTHTRSRQLDLLWRIPLWRRTCRLWATQARHRTGCLREGDKDGDNKEEKRRPHSSHCYREIIRGVLRLSGENSLLVQHTTEKKKTLRSSESLKTTANCRSLKLPPHTSDCHSPGGGRRPQPWTLPRLPPGGPSVAPRHVILAHAAEPPRAARLQNNEQRPKYIVWFSFPPFCFSFLQCATLRSPKADFVS